MKVIAKTTSAINLIEPMTRELLEEIPRVVHWSQFLESRTGKGQIKVLASDLPDEATDKEFQGFLDESDGDVDLAVEAYKSTFEMDEDEPELPIFSREELEKQAAELKVQFKSNISDEKLAERVAEALAKEVSE